MRKCLEGGGEEGREQQRKKEKQAKAERGIQGR
jgi:hypothetical protein